ncbi:MAG: HNH endonuclease [Candidatus Omnitrophica bacterium]|nr:HNH endonuclease [Candidatus Omnitrophota bacterium]
MKQQVPLIYLHGVARGRYLVAWPVFIVGDNPKSLTFTVAVDSPGEQLDDISATADGRRAYITAMVKKRVHQQRFRERVLAAYEEQCACCRLRQLALLEAAHIIPDTEPTGEPIISNGISLCCLHHAAYDGLIIGISPDFRITVDRRVLKESDGPMLRHGLQGLNGQGLILPKRKALWPDRNRLAYRYQLFQENLGRF